MTKHGQNDFGILWIQICLKNWVYFIIDISKTNEISIINGYYSHLDRLSILNLQLVFAFSIHN